MKGSVPLTLSEGGVELWASDRISEIPSRLQNLLSNGNGNDLREPEAGPSFRFAQELLLAFPTIS